MPMPLYTVVLLAVCRAKVIPKIMSFIAPGNKLFVFGSRTKARKR